MKKVLFGLVLIAMVMLPFGNVTNAQSQSTAVQYISPNPDSIYNPPGTGVIVRYGAEINPAAVDGDLFTVTGSMSGLHPGTVVLARDEKTLVFTPDEPFALGEQVSVSVEPGLTSTAGVSLDGAAFNFSIQAVAVDGATHIALQNELNNAGTELTGKPALSSAAAGPYMTAPDDFPNIHILTPAGDVGDGYIFATNFLPGGFGGDPNLGAYLMILDNNGDPVFYQKVPETTITTDYKVLKNGLLAYWQEGEYHLYDNNYNHVRTLSAKNGYNGIDLHDLIVLPNGNYMYIIYYNFVKDMSEVVPGGNENARIIDVAIQEVDEDGNVVFEWKGIDHYDITDTNRGLTAAQIDYSHANAVELDKDGNILLSSRHMDEITKIDHDTGEIIWRLGGKKNQFTMTSAPGIPDDPEFFFQHDIRVLPDGSIGDISLFDNHNNNDPMNSRAMVFDIDEDNLTAELVWQYRNTPDVFSSFMGNAQYLPNGSFVIGWGGLPSPNITEVKQDGTKVFEMAFDAPYVNYRGFRFEWEGYPTWAPDLVLTSEGDNVQLYMSWNGATEIASYEVYGWGLNQPIEQVTEVTKTGFESSVTLEGSDADYCFYYVMPVDNEGQPTRYSNVVKNPVCNILYMPFIPVTQ